jgi:RNA polymerase sigma factor (sigma-70 family)
MDPKILLSIVWTYSFPPSIFLLEVEVLLEKNNSSGVSLTKFTVSRIKALNLPHLDPHDVFMMAVFRGLEFTIGHSKTIKNPAAWLRVTIKNILLEEVRKSKGHNQLSDEMLEKIDFSDEKNQVSFGEYFAEATKAFRDLSKTEQRIILYKLIRGKSYREISQLMIYHGYTEAALRQQYSRAVRNLRENFLKLLSM